MVYATYAIDPKSSGEQPRAIAANSDVIKISIDDKGRDKRTGVIYRAGSAAAAAIDNTTAHADFSTENFLNEATSNTIAAALDGLADDLLVDHDKDEAPDNTTPTSQRIKLTNNEVPTLTLLEPPRPER